MGEIAELIGKGRGAVRNRLTGYGIDIRPADAPPSRELGEESTLRRMYEGQKMSVEDIGNELGHNIKTVARWMDKHGIDRRPAEGRGRTYERPPEEVLQNLYVEQGLSGLEIAERFGCTTGAEPVIESIS